ncbi:MAG: YHS domain-containing protein [Candidatus Omnitrophota bacterium]|nr:MAG: YHS domain-containing protein [Candidatus Omnitrophota bacterium]
MRIILSIFLVSVLSTGYIAAQQHHHGHHGHEHVMEEQTIGGGQDLGICPVMGGKATQEHSYTHEGKTYYFCCPSCIEAFKKNPEKYISKIKEFHLQAYQFGFEPEEITVNKGDIVRIVATSRDVTHGVHIKEYGVSVSVKKSQEQRIEFIADKTGEFPILCSVYCGRGHHQMKAKLIVK